MKFVRLDPPGTLCMLEALRDAMKRCGGNTFLDVGCGSGAMSRVMLEAGLTGIGIDFSDSALKIAASNLSSYIDAGRYKVYAGDVFDLPDDFANVDIVLSYMVMEHVEDDRSFLNKLSQFLSPQGHLIVAVPGRMDHWSIEDETVGHFRRYERNDLALLLKEVGFNESSVWSVSVPISNILFQVGTALLRRSSEVRKINLTKREQTETSGIQDIPWKTTFPAVVKLILNRRVLYPLFVIQRLFYGTGLGLTMMGIARKD
jgi:SAM-dependent methyltransferase